MENRDGYEPNDYDAPEKPWDDDADSGCFFVLVLLAILVLIVGVIKLW